MTDTVGDTRRSDGFLERGGNVTRLEAFVDAAFAFAVTLLVISFEIPGNDAELVDALMRVPAFAASFVLLAYFWFAHHTWSRRYGLDDAVSVCLSLLLVFLVLVWVYPLRALFGAAFGWLTRYAFPDGWEVPAGYELTSLADLQFMFLVYGMAWGSLGVVIALLYRQGWKHRGQLGLNREERLATRAEIARWMWVPVTGAISVVVAYLLPANAPPWLGGAPGVAYATMGLTGVVMTISERRWRARVDKEVSNTL